MRSGRQAADFQLKVQVCADRKTRAADISDFLALPTFPADRASHVGHGWVNLDQAETVSDLDPDAEVVGRPCSGHFSTGCRNDRGAVASQQVDPGVEMEIAAEGRLYRERRRSEPLDDLSAGDGTQELTGVDRVSRHTCAQVRTQGGIDGDHEGRPGNQLRAVESIEAEHGGDIHAVPGAEACRGVSLLDHDNDARHRWHLDRPSHREREAEARIRPQHVPPGTVVLPPDAFQVVSLGDELPDPSPRYPRRGWNGNRFDDDAC